jgi:5-amino-6-(5-phospho-D-ribitylamino)uracil phosphatase
MTNRSTTGIRLIALDLDGTLLDPKQQISPRAMRSVARAESMGVKVMLASARPPRSTRAFHSQLQLSTPSIHYNGALVLDLPTNSVRSSTRLDMTTARSMCELSSDDVIVLAEASDKSFATRDEGDPFQVQTRKLFPYDVVGDWRAWLNEDLHKLMFTGPEQTLIHVNARLRHAFSTKAHIIYSEPNLIQIGATGVSKGKALARLIREIDILPEQVVAIGDADNDIEMLQLAGVSVAMGNASDEVKQHARFLAPTNAHDGCAVAIENVLRGDWSS